MAIKRYPRPGQKISPRILASLLDVPIPWRLLKVEDAVPQRLCELDEHVWESVSPNTCTKLGAAVVREISSRIASLPDLILRSPLPIPTQWPIDQRLIEQLPLEARTYNCLANEGIIESPQLLAQMTIADLLRIPSFGAKSLVDLLATLESLAQLALANGKTHMKALVPAPSSFPAINPRISRYPRPGHRLAPEVLREILAVPVPARLRKRLNLQREMLADFDEKLWGELTTQECARLGEVVVAQVDACLPSLPPNVLYMRLPLPNEPAALANLELERRTYNSLAREGFLKQPGRLTSITIGDLIGLRGIGGKSLVDFLTALEHCQPRLVEESHLEPDGHLEAQATAQRLLTRTVGFHIGREDPRLGQLLRTIDATAASLAELLANITARKYNDVRLRSLAPGLREFEREVERCFGLELVAELVEVSTFGMRARDGDIVTDYYGWDGRGPRTLREIGDRLGLTRERVRQISVEQATRLRSSLPFAPTLRRILDAVESALPVAESGLAQVVAKSGVKAQFVSLRILQQAAQLFGLRLPFNLDSPTGGEPLAVRAEQTLALEPVRRLVRKSAEHWGVGTIAEVAALAGALALPAEEDFIARVAKAQAGCEWLDVERRWYSLAGVRRQRLDAVICKVLAVCKVASIATVRGAVLRSSRHNDFAPPAAVLRAYCQKHEALAVDGDTLELRAGPREPESFLTAGERLLLEHLRLHGEIARAELDALLSASAKRGAPIVRPEQCPILVSLEGGRYVLRCQSTSPARRAAPEGGAILAGQSAAGSAMEWIALGLANLLEAPELVLPSRAHLSAAGEYALVGADGTFFGNIGVQARRITGLAAFARRRGGDIGDTLFLEFDGPARRTIVRVGEGAFWVERQLVSTSPP
ncbi:MAG: DNA-directed RNA polymerase subunit alpha C-terminal domain-containing protein [Planctomycetota bacterium]